MNSSKGQLQNFNHYEHLRRLYLFECVYGLITTFVAGVVMYVYNSDIKYPLLAFVYGLFIGIESVLLLRLKNVTTYHPLLAPRVFHFLSMYLMVLLAGYYLQDIVCKFLILIPLGLSMMSLHPYFLKKYKEFSVGVGVLTGLALIAVEILSKRYQEPLSLENYIFLVYASLLVWLYTFLANGLTSTLKKKMKYYKSSNILQKEQLELAHEKIGRMSYKLSLDFRNSLTVIDGQLQNVLEKCEDPKLQESILASRQETYKLAESIDEFTDSKKSLTKPLVPEVIDLSKLFLNELSSFSEELDKKDISVNFSPYTGELFPIDKTSILTIFRNLLANAIDFSNPDQENKWIKIEAYSKSAIFHLSFADNGMGIPEESKGEVFKMFYSTKHSSENKGLGLYEVMEAIKLLNGEIRIVDSKEHTQFDIKIPFVSLS